MSGHTKGPWYSDEAGIVADSWGLVASIGLPEAFWDRGEEDPTMVEVETMEANARLIAAAPALLEVARLALKTVLDEAEHRNFDPPADAALVAELEAAIARATEAQP